MTTLVDGNALARDIRADILSAIQATVAQGRAAPRIAILQVTDDPAATQYTRRLQRTCTETGFEVDVQQLPPDTARQAVVDLVRALSEDVGVHGIQIQVPLPAHIPLADLLAELDPAKDLDGIHPYNAGLLAQGRPAIVPATPLGGFEILTHHGVALSGARGVVVGRSTPVGRPMALLLLQHDVTVTVCHTRTRDMAAVIREAEIVAVAAGRAGLVTADMIRPGAAVIDFGVNFVDGKTVGDVDPGAAERAGLFTPVPGGTGPMTTAMLFRNALTLYQKAIGAS